VIVCACGLCARSSYLTLDVIQVLHLNENGIKRISPAIACLASLENLRLSHNKLRAIPADIGISHRERKKGREGERGEGKEINMWLLVLTCIPYLVGGMFASGILPNIKVVDVSHNRLWRVPVAISMFVEDLNATGNPLRGLDEGLKRDQSDFKSIHLWIKKNPLSIAHADFVDSESVFSTASTSGLVLPLSPTLSLSLSLSLHFLSFFSST
jgi:Leucine-rich repeat (LRR) protein